MDTGFLFHERYFWHDSGLESYLPQVQPKPSNEGSETKRRFYNLVAVSGLLDKIQSLRPRPATDEEILAVHTPEYLAKLKAVSEQPGGGLVGHEMHLSAKGFEIAALAAGGVISAVEQAFSGKCLRSYCLVRPPGHHAEADVGMGFCAINNVACAAQYALQKLGAKRVAVVDWDVHHGNGTEKSFYSSPDLLFISLHQDRLYPVHTGDVTAVGEGAGRGYNLNIPLPPGSAQGAYEYAFTRAVLPALRAYKPDIILVSSGFDCAFLDPLGRMLLTSDSFRLMTQLLRQAADELCGGRLVLAHEGGYSELYVPFCGLAVLEALSGVKTDVVDPFKDDVGSESWIALQPHQKAAVDRAAENLSIALVPA
jgi:acetoin utilization deacetylase AcuC-like enzyme